MDYLIRKAIQGPKKDCTLNKEAAGASFQFQGLFTTTTISLPIFSFSLINKKICLLGFLDFPLPKFPVGELVWRN